MTKLMPWVGGKAQLMWAIQMLLPTHYKTLVDVFGGSGMDDVPQVPENIRPLLMLSGCCPSALAQLLEEGDIVYAAE